MMDSWISAAVYLSMYEGSVQSPHRGLRVTLYTMVTDRLSQRDRAQGSLCTCESRIASCGRLCGVIHVWRSPTQLRQGFGIVRYPQRDCRNSAARLWTMRAITMAVHTKELYGQIRHLYSLPSTSSTFSNPRQQTIVATPPSWTWEHQCRCLGARA